MVRTRAQNYSVPSSPSALSDSLGSEAPDLVASMASQSTPQLPAPQMATPVDAVARTAIEQQQSTIDQLSALLRGTAPTETLIPPSAAELQSRIVKRITSHACFQKALFPSESSTTPWHFQEAIDVVTSDTKDVSERKLMSVIFTCFRRCAWSGGLK
eukprot:GHVT01019428.1.p1 GENE.GHVT01019428.1~~GHVT01019428.1.p1  ORF type:complete len:157 (-),score=12.24 GHVT01019428.1:294-764(-)